MWHLWSNSSHGGVDLSGVRRSKSGRVGRVTQAARELVARECGGAPAFLSLRHVRGVVIGKDVHRVALAAVGKASVSLLRTTPRA
jgi:hypothetical protein